MDNETAQRLAEAFPDTFDWDGESLWFTIEGGKLPCHISFCPVWRISSGESDLLTWINEAAGQALLHAALRDLCEREGLWLHEVLPRRWAVTYKVYFPAMLEQKPEDAPYSWQPVAGMDYDTPAEAILAAAPEINKRLET